MPPVAFLVLGIVVCALAVVLGGRPILIIRLFALLVLGLYVYAHVGDVQALADDAGSSLLARVKEILP